MPDVGLIIHVDQERGSIESFRPSLVHILRKTQTACWFCGDDLPSTNQGVHLHHKVPLHIAFPDGYGHPSTIDDLVLVHAACHVRMPKGVR